jgi:hypothetical protein
MRAVIVPNGWWGPLLGLVLIAAAVLLVVWWRQQSYRWPLILAGAVAAALALSWWSGEVFDVADYRAGCDGLCSGFRGAPVPTYGGAAAGGVFLPGGFLLNSLVYLVLILGWAALLHALVSGAQGGSRGSAFAVVLIALTLTVGPLLLSPLFLPPPEARARSDPQRIAINARREVYLYDQLAPLPVLRVGLEDVRPRPDNQPGMRVCLSAYTFFYMPVGHLYLDMTPEGVHSNGGGMLPRPASCWE